MGGTTSASGDCTLESGGDIGSSGRSSRNFDIVRLGILDVDFTGVYPIRGPWPFCIESRDVLENDGGVATRLGLLLLLKKDAQADGVRVAVSETCFPSSGFARAAGATVATGATGATGVGGAADAAVGAVFDLANSII